MNKYEVIIWITLIICITVVICSIIAVIYEYIKELDNYSIHHNKFKIDLLESKLDKRDKFYCEKLDELYSIVRGDK